MIDGITVLNNVTISDFNPIPWLGVLIGFLIAFIIIYIVVNDDDRRDAIGIWCAISAVALVLLIADIRFSKVDAIQCTIDDNVSINEVYDNYKVIDRQGEIWTLREKPNEET